MERWFGTALIVIFLWGLGSFLGKLALIRDIPYRVYIFEGIGTLVVLILFVFFKKEDIFPKFSFNIYALLMGLSWGLGTIFFIIALQPAKLSVIVPLTALYPGVTVLLALIFLRESLELKEVIGIVLAILSIALLAK